MSRADHVLVVVLKAQPFRDIEAGVKLEEYRGSPGVVPRSTSCRSRGLFVWRKR